MSDANHSPGHVSSWLQQKMASRVRHFTYYTDLLQTLRHTLYKLYLLAFPILLWYMLCVRAYYLYKDNLLASPILDESKLHTGSGGAVSNPCHVHQPMINWRDSHPASVGPREFYYWLRELTTIHVKVVLPNLWLAKVIWLQQRPLLHDCRSLARFVVE